MKGEVSEPRAATSHVVSIAEQVEARFRRGRRVLSFAEFLVLFDADPVRHSRDASRYLRDVFDHYGKTAVVHPWGEFTRFNLFDLRELAPRVDDGGLAVVVEDIAQVPARVARMANGV